MIKRTTEISLRPLDADGRHVRMSAGALEPVAEVMLLLKRITGTILGSLAFGAQISNVLICLFVILVGPASIIGLLNQ